MQEPSSKRGRKRIYDAERTRQVILDAAEAVFAEHGFDGASVDAIAAQAEYNKSLIFQYFGDKLGLYGAVVKRADSALSELLAQVLAPLVEDETIGGTRQTFKAFLETLVGTFFDYLVEHPQFTRTLLWEQAEGWQTYTRLVSELKSDQSDKVTVPFHRAYSAGLLRSNFPAMIQVSLILQICLSYLTFTPLYALVPNGDEHAHSPAGLARAREYITTFVVNGMMVSQENDT